MFICGSGSFSHQELQDQNESYNTTPCTTTKRSKKSNTTTFCKIIGKDNNTTNKNPYADRGLDKFYALLADLDTKKQQIYTQKGAEDISIVRFVYANDSNAFKPIVVRAKDKNKKDDRNMLYIPPKVLVKHDVSHEKDQKVINHDQSSDIVVKPKDHNDEDSNGKTKKKKKKKKRYCLRSCDGSFRLDNLRQPNYYLFMILVLILLFMAMFGRSFAIMCTSIGWYLINPTITDSSNTTSKSRRPKRKKEYVIKKLSEENININYVHSKGGGSSPTSVLINNKDQQQYGHGRSL